MDHSPKYLQDIITAFDVNEGGKFDEEEFVILLNKLITDTIPEKRKQVIESLFRYSDKARELEQARQKMASKPILPWGWSRNNDQDRLPYYDKIANSFERQPPKQTIHASTFSMMALSAEYCVGKLNDFRTD